MMETHAAVCQPLHVFPSLSLLPVISDEANIVTVGEVLNPSY